MIIKITPKAAFTLAGIGCILIPAAYSQNPSDTKNSSIPSIGIINEHNTSVIPRIKMSNKQVPSVPAAVIKAQMDKYFELKKVQPYAAKELLLLILTEDPKNLIALKEMAYLLLSLNQPQEAMDYFRSALEINPSDLTVVRQMNSVQEGLKKANTSEFVTKGMQAQQKTIIPIPEILQLLNEFYQIKKTDPQKAQQRLQKIVDKYPNNITAQREFAFSALKEKKYELALKHLLIVEELEPRNDDLKIQIGYVLLSLKQPEKADTYFQEAAKSTDPTIRSKATKAMKNLKSAQAPTVQLTEEEQLLNQFYSLNKTNPRAARLILQKLVYKYPRNIVAQREMAFALVKDKNYEEALKRFFIIEGLAPKDYDIKLQIGYLLNNLGRSAKAYSYFSKTTKTSNPELKLKANQAMTNMAGLQTKLLPDPWFADFYAYPLYYSRFDMAIYPGIGRIGRTFGKEKQLETYIINRTTWDNRSGQRSGVNALPQIFQDDVAITAVGARYRLFYNSSFPILRGLQLYSEKGRAYDLIVRPPNLKRQWRSDFRGGLLYWYGWGAGHGYSDKLKLPFKEIGTFYMDVSYFTRYINWIGFYSLKEGLRVLELQTAEVNVYARVRGGFDKNRQFYNNFVEVGPGIEFMPNNRYNLTLRFEHLKGYYIPVNNPNSINTYGPRYNNNLTIAELYLLF